ncbi:MAG TPA: 3-methyladenine DNA glycosylase [Dermatophilaceae bacterium]|nr:3-methyladenine DNA glycosylase [Dermatophilaceae bacterium]
MPTALAEQDWVAAQAEHEARVDALLAAHLQRQATHRGHPVEDFLFTYYQHRPAQLRRWHPGVGRVLLGGAASERESWRFYRAEGGAVGLDSSAFAAARGATVRSLRDLLAATKARPAHLGCFGLHEWAMVYRASDRRHPAYPLRLGPAATDAIVESHQLRCSHFDAFRFFTAPARPLNRLQPTPQTRVAIEQPGCLHATMDLYQHAFRISPATPSELTLACFELARDVRAVDMRASPYDLSALGYQPIPIETADGKAQYVAAQREFAERAKPLRSWLLAVCEAVLSAPAPRAAAGRR